MSKARHARKLRKQIGEVTAGIGGLYEHSDWYEDQDPIHFDAAAKRLMEHWGKNKDQFPEGYLECMFEGDIEELFSIIYDTLEKLDIPERNAILQGVTVEHLGYHLFDINEKSQKRGIKLLGVDKFMKGYLRAGPDYLVPEMEEASIRRLYA